MNPVLSGRCETLVLMCKGEELSVLLDAMERVEPIGH